MHHNRCTLWLGIVRIVALLVVACPLGRIFSNSAAQAADKRPHVIFLFADDQRADTIAALGNPIIKTPTLDSLARRGFVFQNAYCLGANSGAVCLPSRNMLLSGKAYFRWTGGQAPATDSTFPKVMEVAGYETYHHGKNGNVAKEIQAQFQTNRYLKDDQKERTSGEPGKEIVDAAIDFLVGRKSEKPIFMYLAFANPHDPRVAAPRYMQMYDPQQIALPANYLPLHPFNNGEQLIRDEKLAGFPRTEEEIRRHWHDYLATITAFDYHLGRLLQTLRDLKMYDNTLFVFSADHGLAMGSHGLMGKQNLYEHSMKAPLIFAGPGVPQGSSPALSYLIDIFPTVTDLVGGKLPNELDGQSLKPIIEGKSTSVRDLLCCSYRQVQRSVRDQRYKLIRYPQINRTQLFDLQTDPDERHDLSNDPSQQDRVQQMLAQLTGWQKQMGDSQPLTSETPQSDKFDPPAEAKPMAKPKPKQDAPGKKKQNSKTSDKSADPQGNQPKAK